jgi:hypothetical protein
MGRHAVVLPWAGVLCASAALLLSGCGGGVDSASTMAPAPDDGVPQQGLHAVGTITLGVPRKDFPSSGTGGNGHVLVDWTSTGNATTFTVWLSPSAGKPFVEVAANVTGNQARFYPGPSWKLDFPTAQVRVRGCNASGDACSNSNVQPLADVLVEARPTLIPSVDPQTSTVGGSRSYVIDDAGTLIAALRATDLGMFGNPPENFSPARVDLYTGFEQQWGPPQGFPTPDFRSTTGAVALSGDGNTFAIPLLYSFGGQNSPQGVAGVVVVYTSEPNTLLVEGRSWRLQAVIAAPPSLGVVEGLGFGLALSDDGRRLAATATTSGFGSSENSVLVFDKQADGTWKFMAQIPGASNNQLAMSGNGMVIAFGSAAGVTPVPTGSGGTFDVRHFEVRVHECGDNTWPLRATLRSNAFPYAEGAAALDDFGDAGLALSDDGNTLAIGAPRKRSATRAGGVYVFGDVGGGQWQRRALLVNEGEPGADLFGLNLSLSGNGRVLAASACGRFAPSSGVNRNYASSTPPVSADACNPMTQQTGVSHGAHVFQRDEAGAWTKAASIVPTLPPTVAQPGFLVENWMFPLLNRDGSVLGLGAYRNADRDDAQPGEASLLTY